MDTPESPTQSPQSPEEEEKGLSDNELLESPDSPAEVDQGVSDSELLNDDENEVQEGGGDSDFEDGDRVAAGREDPEEVSDLEDYKMDREEREDVLEQNLSLTVRGSRQNASQSPEGEILETPRSPDPDSPGPEHERPFTPAKEERDDEDEATMVVSDLKDESSVSRDLDEHELDYDEEVPEEPSAAAPEEDEGEKGPAREDGEDAEEDEEEVEKRRKKKERKPILPPDNKDTPLRKSEDLREGGRRDSFRDKKKEEDDGEIDEGEIDVSMLKSFVISIWIIGAVQSQFSTAEQVMTFIFPMFYFWLIKPLFFNLACVLMLLNLRTFVYVYFAWCR